jgi:broad specificity phosphatase PhoE
VDDVPRRRDSINLTLIQCGETSWERDDRVHGATDLPLSNGGRAAVQASAGQYDDARPTVIYHPLDEAATETAKIFAEAVGAKTRVVEELADPDLGLLEGLTDRVFAERFPRRYKQWEDDPLSLSPPEGEDLAAARIRVLAAVARVLRRSKSGRIAVVLHPLGIGFLQCWLGDRPVHELWQVLKNRPPVEQYALTAPMIQWLEDAASEVVSRA